MSVKETIAKIFRLNIDNDTAGTNAISQEVRGIVDNYVNQKISLLDFGNQIATHYNGSKSNFFDGFGLTKDLRFVDLYTLQIRSLQLSRENGYAAALFGRLENNVINAGLTVSPSPVYDILKPYTDEDNLNDWATRTAELFKIWGKDTRLVTPSRDLTFSQLQRKVFRAAMHSGDCLMIIGFNQYGMPVIETVDGINIRHPYAIVTKEGNPIYNGVETDKNTGQVVAYYVENEMYPLSDPIRVPVYRGGIKSAHLVKIADGRIGENRGLPLLSVVLQNINEAGKSLDSEQRAALANSYVAIVHTRAQKQLPGNNPIKSAIVGSATATNNDGDEIAFNRMQPGFMITDLNNGETVNSFDTKRPNVNFAAFIESCIKSISYAVDMPPELMMLSFNSNYSASMQAINQMDIKVKQVRDVVESTMLNPIYYSWLNSMILNGDIVAEQYISSMYDPRKFSILGAWRSAQWLGLPKSELSIERMVNALAVAEDRNWTNAKDNAQKYFGTDIANNKRINSKYKDVQSAQNFAALNAKIDNIASMIEDKIA